MGITEIIKRNGDIIPLNSKEPFVAIKTATLNSSLMGDDYISLQIISSNVLSFAKGDKIVHEGKEYTIRATTTRQMESEDYYIYEPVFYGVMYDLMKTLYRNCDVNGKSDRSTFDLTYTIKEFVQVIINNLNRDYPNIWTFDEASCPDTEPRTIQFSNANCLQALQTLCNKEQFNLEFQITQSGGVRTIHIGKFGQCVIPPTGADYFECGKGGGLYKLKEQKIDDKAIITRLWVEGGTANLRSEYRNYSERLQLPFPQRLNTSRHTFTDGTVVEPYTQIIGIADDAKRYLEDAALRDKLGSEEDAKTYDNIYPTRTGKVTAIFADDICAFADSTMDFDLCAKDDNGTKYLVDGVSAKITFITGKLAGQQFELEAKGGYTHATKKFRIKKFTDNRGLTTPTADSEAFRINVGDTFKITEINLPDNYVANAEEDLWYAAMEDFTHATQAKAQYTLTLDRLYFLENISRDVETSVFNVGDYVPVRDVRFGIEKKIRVQKITRNLLLEQDYQLTLADSSATTIQTQTVLTVIDHENIITNNRLRDLSKARRGWRTTEDLRNMVYDTDGYFDTDNIRPNSIDTNMLTVGSKSQQFVLSGVLLEANVGGNANHFKAGSGVLSHLTINDTAITNWALNAQSFVLSNAEGYYLFAKCSKTSKRASWYITQERLKVEPTEDPNNYYFQVGIIGQLHSEENYRDFQTTYGFTRINGNTITTGRIVTSDGECYLDLDGNAFRIGDANSSIDWNVSRQNGLTLHNVSLMSGSGDVSPLGVFRGVWSDTIHYYPNDEVSYTSGGETATYRYINPFPRAGNLPTNSAYWAVVAKGKQGEQGEQGDKGDAGKDGDFTEYRYAKSGSSSRPPTLAATTRNPFLWTTAMPSVEPLEYLWLTSAMIDGVSNALKSLWTTPIRVTPIDGQKGEDGKSPALVFRGEYDATKTYYGTGERVDCVKYNSHYYVARVDAGTFSNVLPTDTSKWNDFGAEFESLATGFLLAENANIANLIFRNERLESYSQTGGVPNFFLDGKNNKASFGAGSVVFDGLNATIGWLRVIGKDLIGSDNDGVQRLRLTPNALPPVGGSQTTYRLPRLSTNGEDWDNPRDEFEICLSHRVSVYENRDNYGQIEYDNSVQGSVEFEITESGTKVNLSEIHLNMHPDAYCNKHTFYYSSVAHIYHKPNASSTEWKPIATTAIDGSFIVPEKGRILIEFYADVYSFDGDFSGYLEILAQAITAQTAKTEVIIAKDGLMAIYNSNYMRMHSTEGFEVRFGNNGFRVTSTGIQKTTTGDYGWRTI